MKSGLFLIGGFLALALLWTSTFVVNETQQVVVTTFGDPEDEPVTTPGLHFKLPYQRLHYFEKRFLEWDGEISELPTRDKRFILVDTYARWRILDPLRFFERLGNEDGAQSRLDDILDGETRNAIANHDVLEVVRTSNRTPQVDEDLAEDEQAIFEAIELGRERIRKDILAAAQTRTEDLGIEILDVRLKRINYRAEDQEKVYDRMIAERKRIAARYRSEGEGEASSILGQRDRDLKEIQSEAYRKAEEIRGNADAEATAVFAEAYDRSADTRNFYELLKSLETLEATVDEDTTLLLSTDGELYRFLKDSGR